MRRKEAETRSDEVGSMLGVRVTRRGTHVHTAWVQASLIGKPNSGEVVWETLLALYLSTCNSPLQHNPIALYHATRFFR